MEKNPSHFNNYENSDKKPHGQTRRPTHSIPKDLAINSNEA